MRIGKRFFPFVGQPREGNSQEKVSESQREVRFQRPVREGVNFLGNMSDFVHGDDRKK
jgi:hypothetical protein